MAKSLCDITKYGGDLYSEGSQKMFPFHNFKEN